MQLHGNEVLVRQAHLSQFVLASRRDDKFNWVPLACCCKPSRYKACRRTTYWELNGRLVTFCTHTYYWSCLVFKLVWRAQLVHSNRSHNSVSKGSQSTHWFKNKYGLKLVFRKLSLTNNFLCAKNTDVYCRWIEHSCGDRRSTSSQPTEQPNMCCSRRVHEQRLSCLSCQMYHLSLLSPKGMTLPAGSSQVHAKRTSCDKCLEKIQSLVDRFRVDRATKGLGKMYSNCL